MIPAFWNHTSRCQHWFKYWDKLTFSLDYRLFSLLLYSLSKIRHSSINHNKHINKVFGVKWLKMCTKFIQICGRLLVMLARLLPLLLQISTEALALCSSRLVYFNCNKCSVKYQTIEDLMRFSTIHIFCWTLLAMIHYAIFNIAAIYCLLFKSNKMETMIPGTSGNFSRFLC